MRTISKEIKESIINGAVDELKQSDTILTIHNSENDGELKLVNINILENNDTFLSFSFDKKGINKKINTELISIDWINKKTDGLIYKYYNNEHLFIIIEVKTSNPAGCSDQFNSMVAFLSYLIKAVQLNNQELKLSKNIKIAKILITGRAKKKTDNKSGEYFNEKIDANEIEFKKNETKPISLNQLLNCKFKPLV